MSQSRHPPCSLDDVPVPVLLHIPVAHFPVVPVGEVAVVTAPVPREGEGPADELSLPQTESLAVRQVSGAPAPPGRAEREAVAWLGEVRTLLKLKMF